MQMKIQLQSKRSKPKKTQFTFVDFFCGIGGFHQALAGLGGTCVMSCEIDKFARETYLANYGNDCPILHKAGFPQDITLVSPKAIGKFDILCAGFPCQPFSQVGKKLGFKDVDRGNLFFEIMRIVDGCHPKVLFLENVRHLIKHDDGGTFLRIKEEIEKRGYSFTYKLVKASDFGLPQHRPRVYIICFDKSQVNNWNSFVFPKSIPLKFTMSDVLGGVCTKEVGFTLRVGGRGSKISDRRNWDSYSVDGEVRRIGKEEGLKMMGFPKNFKFPVLDAQAMKQLGNSVAVPAVSAVMKSILNTLSN